MGKLYITEYPTQTPGILVLAEQSLPIEAERHESNPFTVRTKFVLVSCDAACSLGMGNDADPTRHRLGADQARVYSVNPGDRISVIANPNPGGSAMEPGNFLDMIALFKDGDNVAARIRAWQAAKGESESAAAAAKNAADAAQKAMAEAEAAAKAAAEREEALREREKAVQASAMELDGKKAEHARAVAALEESAKSSQRELAEGRRTLASAQAAHRESVARDAAAAELRTRKLDEARDAVRVAAEEANALKAEYESKIAELRRLTR